MKYTIKDITEIGILVGLALALNLSFFTIHIMPNAGSISFSFIPLFIISLRKAWWKSLIATAVIYGLIACLMDGYGFNYYPLDYMCAYGSISLISLIKEKILLGNKYSYLYLTISVIIITLLRILFSTISGMLILNVTFVYSFIYNSVYISLTGVVTLVILLILLKPLSKLNN